MIAATMGTDSHGGGSRLGMTRKESNCLRIVGGCFFLTKKCEKRSDWDFQHIFKLPRTNGPSFLPPPCGAVAAITAPSI